MTPMGSDTVEDWKREVARWTLDGPLPTKFSVHAFSMSQIEIRATLTVASVDDGRPICVFVMQLVDGPPDERRVGFVMRGLADQVYRHERKEWLRRDGHWVDDPHPELRE